MADVIRALGAVAGLVAIAGLAALAVVYVTHAREVQRLREWAGHRPERARPPRRSSGGRGRRVFAIAGVALLVLGASAAYGVTRMTGGGSVDRPAPTTPKTKRHRAATVAVLNGTTVPGLAAGLRSRIAAAGFRTGTIDVFSDQQLDESVVQYARGYRADAAAVGRRLGIGGTAPLGDAGRALAAGAPVVVIAGADQAP